LSGEGEEVEGAAISTGPRENGTMRESHTASNYTSDTDLPKFKLAELRRVLELLESLAVTEPQKIAPPQEFAFASAAPETVRTGTGGGVRGAAVLFSPQMAPHPT